MPELNKAVGDSFTATDTDSIDLQMVVSTTSDLTHSEGRMQNKTDEDYIQVSDNSTWMDAIGYGSWRTYTPTLTATTTNPTLGSGSVQSGRYTQVGHLCFVQVRIVFGSSGASAGSGTYQVSVPITPTAAVALCVGSGFIQDASGTDTAVFPTINASATVVTMRYQGGASANVTHAVPFAWAINDAIFLSFFYEV